MITNRIFDFVLRCVSIVLLPFWLVSTLVLGLALYLTFGFLRFPLGSIWMLLLYPMVGLSWICNRVPAIRNVIGIVFILWAFFAYTYVLLVPAMDEIDGKFLKLMLCASWPFTWEFWQFIHHELDLESGEPAALALREVVSRISRRNPHHARRVVMLVAHAQPLDAKEDGK